MGAQVGPALTMDDLVALNDEIRALARAGVPLDRGLRSMARDLPGRLGRQADELAQRLEQGENLADAIGSLRDMAPAYRAVLMAGLRSGELPVALEGIATTARRAAQLGKTTAVAMLYPVIVLGVASLAFTFSTQSVSPVIAETYAATGAEPSSLVDFPLQLRRFLVPLLPWLWGAFAVFAASWWLAARRPSAIHSSGLVWVPGLTGLIRAGRTATFLDVLALLLERRVPLPEAIPLAAESSGDRHLAKAADRLVARIVSGAGVGAPDSEVLLTPWVDWLLASGGTSEHVVASLRKASAANHRRAERLGKWVGFYLPMLLAAGLGGLATLLYVLMVTLPFYQIMDQLGK